MQGTSYLEKCLIKERSSIWISHSVMYCLRSDPVKASADDIPSTLGMFSFMSASTMRRFFKNLFVIWLPLVAQLVTYPAAVWKIANRERHIYGAHAVRSGLDTLLNRVKRSQSISDDDPAYLWNWKWDSVPWSIWNTRNERNSNHDTYASWECSRGTSPTLNPAIGCEKRTNGHLAFNRIPHKPTFFF